MRGKPIVVAACAPASHSFHHPRYNKATVRMIAGEETDRARIRAHVDRMLDHHLRLLERAAGAGADVAVIPEDALRMGNFVGKHRRRAFCRAAVQEAVERYKERVGEMCRTRRMFVVVGVMTCRRGRFYNSALMLGPDGRAVAAYDKTHLPPGEAASVTPGRDLPVFDTALGKVGLLICWDIVFPEPFAALALQGAQIVFQPTFGHWHESDDITARSRAMDWAVPLVVSMWGGCACIIDAEGHFAARTGRAGNSLAVASLDLSARRKWLFMDDVRRQKPALRRPRLYRILTTAETRRRSHHKDTKHTKTDKTIRPVRRG